MPSNRLMDGRLDLLPECRAVVRIFFWIQKFCLQTLRLGLWARQVRNDNRKSPNNFKIKSFKIINTHRVTFK